MHIAIDIRTINKPRSGVGYYVTNLINELQNIDKDNKYCLISNNGGYDAEIRSDNFRTCKTIISNENHIVGDLWENTILPRFLQKNGVDIFHGPAFMIPLLKGRLKTVATIHDIVSYVMPETVPFKYAWYMRMLIRAVTRRADKIITDSESTKQDLISWLQTPEERIAVVPLAVSKEFRPAEPDDAVRQSLVKKKFGINGKFMLFVGNLEPRKNLIRVMQAFAQAQSSLDEGYQLVICGKPGWLYHDILAEYEKLRNGHDIIVTDYISEPDLHTLYQSADMFVFPSLYEGFGLPVLEAMASGAPVITSSVSSLPEIAGDAALVVAPDSIDQIADAITRLGNDSGLRASLREKGLHQAAQYSWSTTAQKTLDVYKSLA